MNRITLLAVVAIVSFTCLLKRADSRKRLTTKRWVRTG